ncbi:hypothetical protein HDU97_007216 [Phlyctochytrium planicorne]|nr:hypothetical protein HDU97_007216 [Phlyctochytrium planicorne]
MESPEAVNKGNAFAHAAEEYTERGQYAQAIEAHFRAAEQFLLAMSYTTDPEATKTLKLLYTNHTRQGKELQRRLQARTPASPNATPLPKPSQINRTSAVQAAGPSRIDSFGSGKPVSGMQLQPPPAKFRPLSSPPAPSSNFKSRPAEGISPNLPVNNEIKYSITDTNSLEESGGFGYGSRNFFVGQPTTPEGTVVLPPQITGRPALQNGGARMGTRDDAPATVDVISLDGQGNQKHKQMFDSIDKSYFVLGESTQDVPKDEEPEDPFNKFWDVVENLVQKISLPAPLAFTTAPISAKNTGYTDSYQQYSGGFPNKSPYAFNVRHGADSARDHTKSNYSNSGNMTETLRSANMLNSYFVVGDAVGLSTSGQFQGNQPRSDRFEKADVNNMLGGGGIVTYHEQDEPQDPVAVNLDALTLESNFFGRTGRPDDNSLKPENPVRIPTPQQQQQSLDRGSTSLKTREEIILENEQLRQTVDFLTRRLAVLERAAEENNMLRSSIIQFRQDLQRQAKRFGKGNTPTSNPSNIPPNPMVSSSSSRRNIGASVTSSASSPTASTSGLQPAPPLPSRNTEDRVAGLERELAAAREESERRGEEVLKYRDRWHKLKESARKKKEAKLGQGTEDQGSDNKADGRIVELRGGSDGRPDYYSDTSISETNLVTLEGEDRRVGERKVNGGLGLATTHDANRNRPPGQDTIPLPRNLGPSSATDMSSSLYLTRSVSSNSGRVVGSGLNSGDEGKAVLARGSLKSPTAGYGKLSDGIAGSNISPLLIRSRHPSTSSTTSSSVGEGGMKLEAKSPTGYGPTAAGGDSRLAASASVASGSLFFSVTSGQGEEEVE